MANSHAKPLGFPFADVALLKLVGQCRHDTCLIGLQDSTTSSFETAAETAAAATPHSLWIFPHVTYHLIS